ncbi:MAG: hypothetical protein GX969_06140 [Firmicutes bacterium]|nr:hypothetical protein [Bacillota bacterium]
MKAIHNLKGKNKGYVPAGNYIVFCNSQLHFAIDGNHDSDIKGVAKI